MSELSSGQEPHSEMAFAGSSERGRLREKQLTLLNGSDRVAVVFLKIHQAPGCSCGQEGENQKEEKDRLHSIAGNESREGLLCTGMIEVSSSSKGLLREFWWHRNHYGSDAQERPANELDPIDQGDSLESCEVRVWSPKESEKDRSSK